VCVEISLRRTSRNKDIGLFTSCHHLDNLHP